MSKEEKVSTLKHIFASFFEVNCPRCLKATVKDRRSLHSESNPFEITEVIEGINYNSFSGDALVRWIENNYEEYALREIEFGREGSPVFYMYVDKYSEPWENSLESKETGLWGHSEVDQINFHGLASDMFNLYADEFSWTGERFRVWWD